MYETHTQKNCLLKFGLSEKHTKFEKNLPYGFDKLADFVSKHQNREGDFFKLCASQKVRTLRNMTSEYIYRMKK